MEFSIACGNYHVAERDRKVQKEIFVTIFKRISEHFMAEKYTDVKIHCHDDQQKVFKCHRVVLASASDYFNDIFGNSDQENNVEDLHLPSSINAGTFNEVLKYIYQGQLNVVDSNLLQLLKASDLLRLSFVEECCVRYLMECEIPSNVAIDIFLFAAEKQKNSILPTVSRFILSKVDTFSQNPDFTNISYEYLQGMLSHWPPSSSNEEKALLRAIFRWASHSTEAGEDTNAVSTALLNAVPLQHISRDDVENSFRRLNETDNGLDVEVVAGPLENIQPTLHVYANTKLDYPYGHQNEERPYSTYQTNLCTLQRSTTDIDWFPTVVEPTISYMRTVAPENRIYCLKKQAGSYSFSVSSSADLSTATELSMPPVSSQQRSGFYYRDNSYLMCGNRNYIYFHDTSSPNLSIYDYNTDQWSPVPINHRNRLSVPLCMTCDDSLLYVMGSERSRGKGANKGHSMSAYDPRVGEWQRLDSGWLYHTSRDECCCHRGKIYFSCLKEEQSNYSSYGETCLKGIDVYDPVAARWSSVPGTPENREMYCHRLVSFDNLLWMVSYGYGEYGTGECITMNSYNSFTEQWEYSQLLDSVLINKIYPSSSLVNNVSVRRTLIDVLNFN